MKYVSDQTIRTTNLSMEVISGVAEGCSGNGQAEPSEEQVSLHGNTRREPKDVAIRPAMVLAHTQATTFCILGRDAFTSPNVVVAVLGAHTSSLRVLIHHKQASTESTGAGRPKRNSVAEELKPFGAHRLRRTPHNLCLSSAGERAPQSFLHIQ